LYILKNHFDILQFSLITEKLKIGGRISKTMSEEDLKKYLKGAQSDSQCEDCDESMKVLHFSWGESEAHEGIITVLNTVLEEDEMLEKPLDYEKMRMEYCKNCDVINLSIE